MPHVLGNAGGPPPPTRNETLLQAEVDRLRAQLDECRNACANWEEVARVHQNEAIRARQMDPQLDAARQVVETTRGHDCATRWRGPCGHQFKALAFYDKLTKAGGAPQ
jgi:hypothetical protein